MADVKENLLFEELLSRYRKKKKALCFHLGIKQKHIARTRVTEDVELIVVINTGRQTSSKDLAQALACQQGEKNWRRYLKVFSRSAWVEKGIRGNLADAQQTWAQGKAILKSDPDHAVQLMQNAIALLECGLNRCATAAAKNLKVLRIRAVVNKLGIARSTIYDWINPKSPRYDATFPKQRRLGMQSVGWFESELDEWLLKRHQASSTDIA